MAPEVWYCTREQVMYGLEVNNTSQVRRTIDDKIRGASRSLEGLLHRRFYPELRTFKIDWPNWSFDYAWQLDLGDNELISLTSLVSGGVSIPTGNVILRRDDDKLEPPYTVLEISLASSSALSTNNTFQQSQVITGLTGWSDTDTGIAGAALGGNINGSVTTVVINPSAGNYTPGVGSIVLVGTERMILTERTMSDTGVNSAGALTANKGDVLLPVGNGSLFAVDEVILVDAERMRIQDIAGNNLIVTRAWDGTVLAVHNTNADVFALRTFTAYRGALGSTAASHSTSDPVYVHQFPGLINELAVAEASVGLDQFRSAYSNSVGSSDNQRDLSGVGLPDLRERTWEAYGRKGRKAGI